MQHLDKINRLRCFVMDSLVSKSGQNLLPTLIGELTKEIVEGAQHIFDESGSNFKCKPIPCDKK